MDWKNSDILCYTYSNFGLKYSKQYKSGVKILRADLVYLYKNIARFKIWQIDLK